MTNYENSRAEKFYISTDDFVALPIFTRMVFSCEKSLKTLSSKQHASCETSKSLIILKKFSPTRIKQAKIK